jgi:hypothetical protein
VNLASNDLKEKETIHQMIEDMDLENLESHPTNIGQDEAYSMACFSLVTTCYADKYLY